MKNIIKNIIAGTMGLAALTACSDFLDQQSPSELTSQTVFESTYYAGQVLNRCYGEMGQDNAYTLFIPIHMGLNTDCELVGNALGPSNSMDGTRERGNMNYNSSPEWTRLESSWNILYGIIETANGVIEGVDGSSLIKDPTTNDAKTMLRYKGEALTIRAMIYFDLIRIWGDVPMKMESSRPDRSNAYLPKTDRDVIMDRLMDDLDEAIELLPWAGENGYTTERATKGYAHALLANIALTRGGWAIREASKDSYVTAGNSDATYPTQRCSDAERKSLYERALKHLSILVNNPVHRLNPSYANEWELVNRCELDVNYRENIFEIPMGIGATGELGYTAGVKTLQAIANFFNAKNNASTLQMTSTLLYSFQPKDTRRDITCSAVDLTEKDGALAESFGIKNTPFQIHCGKWDVRKMSQAYRDAALSKGPNQKTCTGINPIRMRYPQVLLMYAEVMNELAGGADTDYSGSAGMTARQALAEVHCRAYNEGDKEIANAYVAALPADRDAFFQAIVDENKWELAGEGLRKFDLIRWNLLDSEIAKFKETYLAEVEDGTYPETIYYNYTDESKRVIDLSSITWNGLPEGADPLSYDGSNDFFGKERSDSKKTQSKTNLPYISAGLNATVKNRYIMPLGNKTVSSSNGVLKNSYGF